jgi:hypothetical protein
MSAVEKEINFFSHFFHPGVDYYYAHFPAIVNNNYLTGEATPSYFFLLILNKFFSYFPILS